MTKKYYLIFFIVLYCIYIFFLLPKTILYNTAWGIKNHHNYKPKKIFIVIIIIINKSLFHYDFNIILIGYLLFLLIFCQKTAYTAWVIIIIFFLS